VPGVIDGGANAAVTPVGSPVTEKVMGELYEPLLPAAENVYWAVPPLLDTVCDALLAVIAKSGATPVPASVAACGEPAALSDTAIEAERLPPADGLNVTLIEHDPPAANVVPQVLVEEKEPAFVPAIAIPLMASGPVPGLDNVMVCAADVDPTIVLANVRDVGERTACGVGGATPVPVTVA